MTTSTTTTTTTTATTARASKAATPSLPMLSVRTIAALARKEVRESLRNRWFLFYTVAFTVLSLALSYVSLAGTGSVGFAGFGRTAAGLINLVLLIVPLMGLTIGAGSLSAEQENGTLAYLIAQPLGRIEVLLGKFLGLGLAMFASLAMGFGVCAGVIALRAGGGNASSFLGVLWMAMLLALAMLSVGVLISTLTRRAAVATGTAVFLWLTLVFLGDLGLMGGSVVFKLRVDELFHLSLINPLQVFKMSAIGSFDATLDVLGPAGLYAMRTYGDSLQAVLIAVLIGWSVVPLSVAALILHRKSIT